jgi:tRNA-splicing ligase RtcB
MPVLEQAVPAGLGRWHERASTASDAWLQDNPAPSNLGQKRMATAANQFGTLGSGNHFVEFNVTDDGQVWVVLHSGSRGIGNQLAQDHIQVARDLAQTGNEQLEDIDLAWLTQGTPQFDAYIADMQWAQQYAHANRHAMMDAILHSFARFAKTAGLRPNTLEAERLSCHHNYTQQETHDGVELWVTRKGAIKADKGDRGIIPGSMGTGTYIVSGLGNPMSWNSCSHGAGRRMSRGEARRSLTASDLRRQMAGKVWLEGRAEQLIDESPAAYKDVEQVMADQTDLVQVDAVLHQILNYKGTDPGRRSKKR